MLEKFEILIVIFFILIIFYLVIYWGAGGKKKSTESTKVKNYLFGVQILIIIIAVVSVILWTFL